MVCVLGFEEDVAQATWLHSVRKTVVFALDKARDLIGSDGKAGSLGMLAS